MRTEACLQASSLRKRQGPSPDSAKVFAPAGTGNRSDHRGAVAATVEKHPLRPDRTIDGGAAMRFLWNPRVVMFLAARSQLGIRWAVLEIWHWPHPGIVLRIE